jgi:glycosyltransferase 2 family protein
MWRLLAKGAISVALIWLLARNRDLASILRRMLEVEPGLLAAAGLLLFALSLPIALRWSAILRRLRAPLGVARAFPLVLIGSFFNMTLPSSIGGDAMRIWLAHRAGVAGRAAVTSVLIDRLAGLAALLILVAMGLPALFARVADPAIRLGVVGLLMAGCCGLAFLMLLDHIPLRLIPARLGRLKPLQSAFAFSAELRSVLLAPRAAVPVILLSLLNQLGYVAAVWLLARGLSIPVGPTECLIVVPFAILAAMLPVSIAGWGMREGAFVAGFGFLGIASGQALSLSLLLGLLTILVSLPGGAIWLLLPGGRKRPGEKVAAPWRAAASVGPKAHP